jgi:hypothetical protein
MNCPNCNLEAREHDWHCFNCLTAFDVPNVRRASRADEVAALDKRFDGASRELNGRGLQAMGEEYLRQLANSVVVLCRGYADVFDLIKSENEAYATFHQLAGLPGAKMFEDVSTSEVNSRVALA